MEVNGIELHELQRRIIHSKSITPQAKGLLGMILFKIENKLELEECEESFLNEIFSYLNLNTKVS